VLTTGFSFDNISKRSRGGPNDLTGTQDNCMKPAVKRWKNLKKVENGA